MKKQILSAMTVAAIASQALAGTSAPTRAEWLRVQGEANIDWFGKDSTSYESNLRVQDARIRLTAQIQKHVKAVLQTQLERMLIVDGIEVGSGVFDVERFIEEAYIEINMNEQTGIPTAVIIGKHVAAFGQQVTHMPMLRDNLLHDLTKHEQVIGITVKLEQKWFEQVLGSLEVSVFENTQNDLKIGDAAGLSVRLSRQLTSSLKATASAMAIAKDNNYVWNDADKRAALGFVYTNGNGGWKAYAEGIIFENHPKYTLSKYGVMVGGAKQVGRGEVAIEYSYVDKVAHEIAFAYNLPVTKNLIVSPELRHTRFDAGGTDTRIGVRSKVHFDSKNNRRN